METDNTTTDTPDMRPTRADKAVVRVSHWVSDIFSPLLMATYGMAMAMWLTRLNIYPQSTRLLTTLAIFIITAVIPAGVIFILIRLGKVSDTAISNRRQRYIPMSVGTVCYIGAAIYLHTVHAPVWLQHYFWGAATACAIAGAVTFRWKISAHATGVGGLVGLVLRFAVSHLAAVPVLPWLIAVIIVAGLVGTARLVLHHHTPWQVFAGMALGLLSVYIWTAF